MPSAAIGLDCSVAMVSLSLSIRRLVPLCSGPKRTSFWLGWRAARPASASPARAPQSGTGAVVM
eukprot:4200598-Alexandrium_andersonii.AAC.1